MKILSYGCGRLKFKFYIIFAKYDVKSIASIGDLNVFSLFVLHLTHCLHSYISSYFDYESIMNPCR